MDSAPSPQDTAAEPSYTVAVRALCAFTARSGDLDRRFAPTPSAEEGVRGHAALVARRSASYRRELPLEGRWGPLRVRGRADGWDEAAGRLEEIKTFRGRLDTQPAGERRLHWAQLKVYGALLCAERGLRTIELALVYYDIDRGEETCFHERHDAAALQHEFEQQCAAFLAWAQAEAAHRQQRDAALDALPFPMPAFRDGQRALSVAVWRSAQRGQVLMAQAPTGIGKTLGVLFPLLKALPARGVSPGLDKLYVLTAKTPGRAIALDALRRLQPPSGGAEPALRVLELVARETACEYPGRACHGEDCPLARGFWDRLPAARAAAVAEPGGVLDAATLRRVGLAHTVCPYHLAQELLPWVDAVVGDYNHWFDSGGMLYARTTEEGWRVAVAVDEAHNLVERARSMYSASLDALELRAARRTIARPLAAPLRRLERVLARVPEPAPERVPERPAGGAAPPAAYRAFDALPDGLSEALHAALAALTQAMLEAPAAQPEPAALALPLDVPADAPERVDAAQRLRELGYTLGAWLRLAERFGAHSMFEVDASRSGAGVVAPGVRYGLRNLVPGPHLASRWSAAVTTVLFSATLRPEAWHADLLGLPAARLAQVDVPAPFAATQLRVQVAQQLSTRWRDRARSLPALVDLMAAQWRAEPGNYLAFFSSHDYLQQAHAAFTAAHPDVPVWAQSRAMPEPERAAFLARFVPAGRGIGFAVLGGAFGEGIDLVGDRLIGAFIATLGLPSVSPVLEAMRERIDAQFPGRGDDYVGLYPGLQRVVQAAGRVIRGPEDRGILVFMDDRYASARVRALLPSWWPQPTLLRR